MIYGLERDNCTSLAPLCSTRQLTSASPALARSPAATMVSPPSESAQLLPQDDLEKGTRAWPTAIALQNDVDPTETPPVASTSSSQSLLTSPTLRPTLRHYGTGSRTSSPARSFVDSANPDSATNRRRRPAAPPKRKLRSKLLFIAISLLLALCVYASFVDDFMGAVEAGISCGTCIGLLLPLKALANVGDDAFVDFFVGFCTKLGVRHILTATTTPADPRSLLQIEDADVCAGAVGTQAPILAHDLRSISLASHAAKNFCSTVFGLCPLQEVIPYLVTFADAPLGMEESAAKDHKTKEGKARKWVSKGRKPFQVVHLSDVHVDRKYLVSFGTQTSRRGPS